MWFEVWAALGVKERGDTRLTWRLALGDLLTNGAFSYTTGPVEAAVMAILDIGWSPSAPDKWTVATDATVTLDGNPFSIIQVLS